MEAPVSPDVRAETVLQLVSFRLGAEEYAVDVADVQEIVRATAVTAVPRAASYVEGVVNLRGRIVPVIDLAARFGLPRSEAGQATRIMIAELNGHTTGMRVDAVSEVLRLPASAVEPTPELLASGPSAEFITGIGKLDGRLLLMLDLARVLADGAQESP